MRDKALWFRLQGYPLGGLADGYLHSRAFAAETGWKPAYTEAVVEEYRKFLYLACVSDGAAMPPPDVDYLWSLHRERSRETYIEALCVGVLDKLVKHPGTSGKLSKSAFKRHFSATRKLYQEEFGEAPAPAVWGGQTRFSKRRWGHRFAVLGLLGGVGALFAGGGMMVLMAGLVVAMAGMMMTGFDSPLLRRLVQGRSRRGDEDEFEMDMDFGGD
ncbi:MAG: hypothetical protein AAFY59_11225 [Pseudomonadota bacterium]